MKRSGKDPLGIDLWGGEGTVQIEVMKQIFGEFLHSWNPLSHFLNKHNQNVCNTLLPVLKHSLSFHFQSKFQLLLILFISSYHWETKSRSRSSNPDWRRDLVSVNMEFSKGIDLKRRKKKKKGCLNNFFFLPHSNQFINATSLAVHSSFSVGKNKQTKNSLKQKKTNRDHCSLMQFTSVCR